VDYSLDLISNFTYFTDPVNGDQFEQVDDRRIYGTDISWRRPFQWLERDQELVTGVQVRMDDIGKVALYRTVARERFGTVREDSVKQTSYSAYASLDTRWSDVVRTIVGLRSDYFDFDVDANLSDNSGQADDSIVSPKFALVLGPWAKTEFFFDIGNGFH